MTFQTLRQVLLLALLPAGLCWGSPVVVELFTSQGCSSCPDADALISRWGLAEFKKGTVLPLSYDVDYWDYLGWKDIFSAPAYSRRQHDYAEVIGTGVYTPQIVVNGRSSFAGSDEATAKSEVGRFLGEEPVARIRIAAKGSPRVQLTVTVEPLKERKGSPHLMLALFENGLVTRVLAGENRGRTLHNDFVVRRLRDLGPLPEDGKPFQKSVEDPWDPAWRKDQSGVAVFIQDLGTRAIAGAGFLYPLKPGAPRPNP